MAQSEAVAAAFQPLSSQACERCYRRKKKCDRKLPKCGSCHTSRSECVYELQVASYPIEYVRQLEAEVEKLKAQLTNYWEEGTSQATKSDPPAQREDSRDLAQELGALSLSASAEGHYLGPGSGISFARLTQSVIQKMGSGGDMAVVRGGIIVPSNQPGEVGSGYTQFGIPSVERSIELVGFYWEHSHSLYPFVRKSAFMRNFNVTFGLGISDIDAQKLQKDPVWMFQLYMVMAIGSTSIASINVTSEEEAVGCCSMAMSYLEDVLSRGNRAALECLMLLISYSFFNMVGPDTWYLVGIASRLALGMGLHTQKSLETLDPDQKEHAKLVFWSLYMMDRVVSSTLGRPLAIRDQEIDVSIFSESGPLDSGSGDHHARLAVTSHILRLRTITGKILERVYSAGAARETPEDQKTQTLYDLHEQLIQWRQTTPIRSDASTGIPHLTMTWSSLNYNNLVAVLFRPSPLIPDPPPEHLRLVAGSAVMALRIFTVMAQEKSLSFNWLNLFSVFSATLALIFTATKSGHSKPYVTVEDTIACLKMSRALLDTFSIKLPPAQECRKNVESVLQMFQAQTDGSLGQPQAYFSSDWDAFVAEFCGPDNNINDVQWMEPLDDGLMYF